MYDWWIDFRMWLTLLICPKFERYPVHRMSLGPPEIEHDTSTATYIANHADELLERELRRTAGMKLNRLALYTFQENDR